MEKVIGYTLPNNFSDILQNISHDHQHSLVELVQRVLIAEKTEDLDDISTDELYSILYHWNDVLSLADKNNLFESVSFEQFLRSANGIRKKRRIL